MCFRFGASSDDFFIDLFSEDMILGTEISAVAIKVASL